MALRQDFEIIAGDVKELRVTVGDYEGNLVDLAGFNIEFKVFLSEDGESLVTKDTTRDISVLGLGEFAVLLREEDTSLRGTFKHQTTVFNDSIKAVVMYGTVKFI